MRRFRLLLAFHSAGLLLLILVAAAYVLSYYSFVRREPVFYGNKLKQISLAVLDNEGGRAAGRSPDSAVARVFPTQKPDAYRAKYSTEISLIPKLFAPAHWLDRVLRPSYWPPEKSRNAC